MTDEKDDDVQTASAPNLEDAFESDVEEQEEVGETTKTPDPKAEQKGEDTEDETVDEAEEAEDEAEPPAADSKHEGKSVPVAALRSERQKRQQAEARADALEKKLNPDKEKTDEEVHSEFADFGKKTEWARKDLMEEHDDYQAMENIFAEEASSNPELVQQMMAANNPAKFAYRWAKESPKGKEYAEFQEFRANKAKAALETKSTKVIAESPAEKRKQSVLAVPKLNKAASIGSNSTPKETAESLDDMFED